MKTTPKMFSELFAVHVVCIRFLDETPLVPTGRSSYASCERIRLYMARFTKNRWASAIIPALLIHIPIGTVYCWSVFKQLIADQLHASPRLRGMGLLSRHLLSWHVRCIRRADG